MLDEEDVSKAGEKSKMLLMCRTRQIRSHDEGDKGDEEGDEGNESNKKKGKR
jgi:hypothetical protein